MGKLARFGIYDNLPSSRSTQPSHPSVSRHYEIMNTKAGKQIGTLHGAIAQYLADKADVWLKKWISALPCGPMWLGNDCNFYLTVT